ncbi:hypothetical protein CRM22_007961 [Opisthorchis felineus]|uniref:Uncharacterized protein n=1 Tax=Opisthorchis felineus TaxID=147828 RepID=A0A4S2LE41_OPIFE|nr:hypothetical protein CRM22_007961 [Opisthorchis felineus]
MIPTSSQLRLPIGIEGISCLTYLHEDEAKQLFALGTTDGRVRIYRSLNRRFECTYQKRWHKSIRCLSLLPSTSHLVSTSSQSGLKVHDIESEKRIWAQLHAHKKSPISSLLCTSPVVFVTGDEDAIVQVWDIRKPGAPCHSLRIQDEEQEEEDLFGAVNDMACGDSQNLILAALDNGSLAALNLRKARVEVLSDTLGYSARTVTVIKNNKVAVVGTEDGAICLFNWNEFELCADRFSPFAQRTSKATAVGSSSVGVGPSMSPSVEKVVKVTEDMIAVATDDGKISAVMIRPNEVLGIVGRHPGSEGDHGADCLNLAVSPYKYVASVCPESPIAQFFSLSEWIGRSESLISNPSGSKKKRRKVVSTAMSPDRAEYLSGLLPEKSENGGSESSSELASSADSGDDGEDDTESDSC